MKSGMILAAKARFGHGGMGLNLLHMRMGLGEAFDLKIFCDEESPHSTAIPTHPLLTWGARYPLLRRFRNWWIPWEETHFDLQVAQRLQPCHLFQGITGQCFHSLRVAQRLKMKTVVDVVTLHIKNFSHAQAECAHFGIRPPHSIAHQERIEAEYQRADLIRVMSEVAAQSFRHHGYDENKLVVVPPPYALEEFPVASPSQEKFRVNYVGLLEPWKGFHYLVEAFRTWKVEAAELVLWGGTGARPIYHYLQNHLQKDRRIQLRPESVRDAGWATVFGQSHVLVHPSLADGFGYVVGEAMACGVPAIVTDQTGAADLIKDGENGYIVPCRDGEAIRERLDFLMRNPQQQQKMAAAARATMEKWDLEEFRRRYLPALNKHLHS